MSTTIFDTLFSEQQILIGIWVQQTLENLPSGYTEVDIFI